MAGGAVASASGVNAYTHLMDPSRKWYNNRRLITLNAWIVLLLITLSLTQWEDYFNHPKTGKLGLLNAIQNIGGLAGYPFAPYLSDGIGRRRTVFLGAAIMCIATAIQTASQSVGMFIGARFLIGFGLTFAANAAPIIRAPLTSTYNSLWYSGAIVAAWATFGTFKIQSTWAWRALPSVLQVFLVLFCPESPRKGREAEALHLLAHYHADGNEDDPLVKYEFEEIKTAIEFDRTVAANVGWKSFFATPGNRKRVRIIVAIAFFSQWSANGLVSYYPQQGSSTPVGVTDPTIQLLINGILQIWNLAWALRGQTICTARFRIDGNESAAHAVIAFIFFIAFTPLIVTYSLEILPYNIRAKGFTIFNFTISLALIFNQYVNPIALDHIDWKYYIVYCGIFLYFFVIETKNRTLEETAAIFDGDSATEKIVADAAAHAGVKHDIGIAHDDDDEKVDESQEKAST
ncbi:hexose transporter [Mycena amicta]|nr:hexose transporter [Mycena amicta]